ncbi:MAG: response regulator [Oscillatoriales cyanobacterium RM2_1_1]|nr:response regulator [Oscillatoriales cyanobacterium SM2_3_0]NJO45739.1 response regulator [Oscillatoriales cyanobacterium RM2_1_1]
MPDIRILVVEDEAIVAEDIATRLEKMGYKIENIVASGEEAIQISTQSTPDLILMDIILQGEIDGIEAAQHIQETLNIPIIYLTANADDVTLNRVSQTSPSAYLLKPFKSKELQVAIQIALSRHQTSLKVQEALNSAQKLQQETEAKNQLKSQYISMASHDLRTPISIIKMSTHLLEVHEDLLSADKRQQYLRRIHQATDNLTQLLEDVLTLAQAESIEIAVDRVPLEVVSFCRDLIEGLQFSAGDSYQLELLSSEEVIEASLDEQLFWHLLSNLLSNAIKYSPKDSRILIKLSARNQLLELRVQDQGIGITPEEQAQLFQPFYRANNVGNIPGTGLGLAIAQRAANLHQGKIEVESQVNQGTTFIVTLPLGMDQNSPQVDIDKH